MNSDSFILAMPKSYAPTRAAAVQKAQVRRTAGSCDGGNHFVLPMPMCMGDFKKLWRKACEDAGYPGKLFHDFRRTAVRNFERAAVPRSTATVSIRGG